MALVRESLLCISRPVEFQGKCDTGIIVKLVIGSNPRTRPLTFSPSHQKSRTGPCAVISRYRLRLC